MAVSRVESTLLLFLSLLLLSSFLQQLANGRTYKDDRSHVLMGLGCDFEFADGHNAVYYHNFVCT